MDKVGIDAATGQSPRVPGHEPVRCLGQGANGSVWLIAPDDGGPCLAAKTLTVAAGDGADTNDAPLRHNESQITQEWRVLAQFRHDHLIPVHGVVQDFSGAWVLLMDHAAGGSLEQVVSSRGTLEVGEAVTVLTPMGQVLAFLHARGAVHGDVSPGNVLLSSAGKPLLSDFGFGRLLGQEARPLAGTPGFYCSTDTLRDEAADVYALASVGWYALTGRPAPPTRDRLPLGAFVGDVPGELVAALEAGLDEDPARRPTAAAFAQAVFRSSAAVPVALGHAVHPSVLPELLTRKEAKDRRAKGHAGATRVRRGGRATGAQRPHAIRRRKRAGSLVPFPVLPRWLRLRELWLNRQGRRMGPLWGSGVAKARVRGTGADTGAGIRPGTGAGHGSGRRAGRRVVMLALVVAVAACLALAAVNGAWLGPGAQGQGDTPGTNSHGTASASQSGWSVALPAVIRTGLAAEAPLDALPALAWLRSYALSTANAALLSKVNAPGSPARDADLAVLASLEERGHMFSGLQTSIEHASIEQTRGVQTRGAGASRTTVGATVTTSAFIEQDAAGNVVHRQEKPQQQVLEIVMVKVEGRWVIEEILGAG